MKNSLIILCCFIAGVVCGRLGLLPTEIATGDMSTYVLYALLFTVGITMGSDTDAWRIVGVLKGRILLVPGAVIAGTLLGVLPCALLFDDLGIRESLAVGSGFGYYSLSSIIISRLHSESLGTVALIANISREIITLLSAPLLVRLAGPLAPITAGGATSMDTTLPVVTRFSGKQYAMISVFSGFTLTLLVPFLVSLILA